MSWTSPQAFAWITAVLVILAIYLIRGAKRNEPVATMFLWQRALAKRPGWIRLRPWATVVWRSLIVLLLVLAMAAPMWGPLQMQERDFVFVIDATASMRATDVKPSRFEQAKSEIQTLMERLGPSDRAALVVVQDEPFVLVRLTGDRTALDDALKSLKATDSTGDAARGIVLARQLVRDADDSQILVFSDTNLTSPAQPGVHVRTSTNKASNWAITAISTRRPMRHEAQQAEVVVNLQRFGDDAKGNLTLHWLVNGAKDGDSQTVAFDGDSAVIRRLVPRASLVEVRIENLDQLASDNLASIDLSVVDDNGKIPAAPSAAEDVEPSGKATVNAEASESPLFRGFVSGVNVTVGDAATGELLSPDKSTRSTSRGQNVVGPLNQVGLWSWKSDSGETHQWRVNLCSPSESNIAAGDATPLLQIEPGQEPPTPMHAWFIALAVLAWAAEWIAFSVGVTE